MVVGCAEPQQLPERVMTQAEVELAWGRDRAALRFCRDRHGALVVWVKEILKVE
jgi:hypothetical protein